MRAGWMAAAAAMVAASAVGGWAAETTPRLEIEVDRTMLWPPNHELVPIRFRVVAVDSCGCRTVLNGNQFALTITQDEPVDVPDARDIGDGAFAYDAYYDVDACGCYHLCLRAERQGPAWDKDDKGPRTTGAGDGRVYLLRAAVTYQGTLYEACKAITVPHGRSAAALLSAAMQAAAAQEACDELEYDSEGEGPCPDSKKG